MTGARRSPANRWESVLQDLADRLDMQAHVERYEFPERRRQTGDWWRNKDQWCVHLNYRQYAWFEGPFTSDPLLQRTISWSLEVISMNQTVKWQDVLLEWAADLSTMPREELFRQIHQGKPFPVGANWSLALPGYFICLSLQPMRSSMTTDSDTRAQISEVVEALLPHGWIAWLPDHTDEGSIALVYASQQDMVPSEQSSEMGDAEEDREARDTALLMMQQLTQALAADAMVSCQAAIGSLVSREHGIYVGLATAVASWRTRDWMSPSESVLGWGLDPAQTLLLAMPTEGLQTFLDAASEHRPTPELQLSAELMETLFGLIDANLNVSEASRLLYLHRNTLMNRIERIRQQTGYDVRVFRDAMTLWLVSAALRMTQCP